MQYIDKLKALKYTDRLILPLAGISWFSIEKWLEQSWLTKDRKHVIVHTTVRVPGIRNGRYFTDGNRHLTIVPIPQALLPDIDNFIEGKYSKFSDRARRLIIDLSGLPYNMHNPAENTTHNHVLLIAIDNTPDMQRYRERMREDLSMELYGEPGMLDENTELLSPPGVREEVFYQGELP